MNKINEILDYLKNDDYCLLDDNRNYKLLYKDETKIILNHIDNLQNRIDKAFKIVDDKLTELNLRYGVNNEFREEYDELWEILKRR